MNFNRKSANHQATHCSALATHGLVHPARHVDSCIIAGVDPQPEEIPSSRQQTIRCPFCGAPSLPVARAKVGECEYCGSSFSLEGGMCPVCGTYNGPEAESCSVCGEPLNTLARVFQRHRDARKPPQFIQQARLIAPELRATGAAASLSRMNDMETAEGLRQQSLHRQMEQQKAKDKLLMQIGLGAVAVFLVFVLAAAIFMAIVR